MITEPIAAIAAEAEPEMAPNMVQLTTHTIPNPPLILPKKDMVKAISLREISASLINPPAIMNRGRASSVKDSRFRKAAGIANLGSRPVMKSIKKPPRPKAKPTGTPRSIIITTKAIVIKTTVISHLLLPS
jgi:hypothetical protein